MKKILFILILFLGLMSLLPINVYAADIVPQSVSTLSTKTLGLYQASNELTLYTRASEKSDILHSIRWRGSVFFPDTIKPSELFVVYVPNKNLALLAVTDETEDWVEVIYNNTTGDKGWIKKDDPYKFMTWINFINMYGKKYGLILLKGAPDEIKDLRSGAEDDSQIVGRINHPQKINLNAVRGNWALVSVFDMDRTPKTGYVRWRSDSGVKYFFPDVK